MDKLLLIGLGGFLGTVARYMVSGWVAQRIGEHFPWGTVFVNALGCFLIGGFFYLTEERFLIEPVLRTVLLIGLLGGFTTFSSFGLQTFLLLRDTEFAYALLNIMVSNLGGVILVWSGYALARTIW